jgi:hypothetical protein
MTTANTNTIKNNKPEPYADIGELVITHFYLEFDSKSTPDGNLNEWSKMHKYSYIAQSIDRDSYCIINGVICGPMSQRSINDAVAAKDVIPLSKPIKIADGKNLYMTPCGEVYYASEAKNLDEDKIKVYSPRF